MGFAWKSALGLGSLGLAPAGSGPDTEFGAEFAADTAAPPVPLKPSNNDSAASAALRLADVVRGARPAPPVQDDGDAGLMLPFIGHMSLPRQLRILLVVFGAGILVTIFD